MPPTLKQKPKRMFSVFGMLPFAFLILRVQSIATRSLPTYASGKQERTRWLIDSRSTSAPYFLRGSMKIKNRELIDTVCRYPRYSCVSTSLYKKRVNRRSYCDARQLDRKQRRYDELFIVFSISQTEFNSRIADSHLRGRTRGSDHG